MGLAIFRVGTRMFPGYQVLDMGSWVLGRAIENRLDTESESFFEK